MKNEAADSLEQDREKFYDAKDRMMRNFHHRHLPPHLAELSAKFTELARTLVDGLPSSAERTAGLRKLLEAKDCAVRALVQAKEDAARDAQINHPILATKA